MSISSSLVAHTILTNVITTAGTMALLTYLLWAAETRAVTVAKVEVHTAPAGIRNVHMTDTTVITVDPATDQGVVVAEGTEEGTTSPITEEVPGTRITPHTEDNHMVTVEARRHTLLDHLLNPIMDNVILTVDPLLAEEGEDTIDIFGLSCTHRIYISYVGWEWNNEDEWLHDN